MQREGPSFIDGKFWQLIERNDEDLNGIRLQSNSGLHNEVFVEKDFEPGTLPVAHSDNERRVLGSALIGLNPGILKNDTTACRQRGQAIEPGGPVATVDVLVEQRYSAHLVQNS